MPPSAYASWYGDAFHGRRTANGEIFDRNSISAAHPTMPLPSYARVTNLRNHYSMIVRVNDRGPFAPGRIMDVSRRVADLLDFRRTGTTMVKVEYVGRASLEGSNDEKLASTLRIDDRSAPAAPPSMLADADAPVQTASADPNEVPQPASDPAQDARNRRRLGQAMSSSARRRCRPRGPMISTRSPARTFRSPRSNRGNCSRPSR